VSGLRILVRDQEIVKNSSRSAASEAEATVMLWTDDRTSNRVKSSLDEFGQLSDSDELIVSLDEPPKGNRAYKKAFELTVSRIVEGRDSERKASLEAIRAFALKSKLNREDITDVLADTLEFLPDISIDSPMAIGHVATLLALTVELELIDIAWLIHESGGRIGDGTKEHVPERKELLELLLSRVPEHRTSELKSLVATL